MDAVAMRGRSQNWIRRSVRIGRVLLRLVITLNVVHLFLLQFTLYFRAVNEFLARFSLQFVDVNWMLASAVFLPFFVAIETWYLFRVQAEKRALIIDWILALGWSAAVILQIMIGLYKYYPYI